MNTKTIRKLFPHAYEGKSVYLTVWLDKSQIFPDDPGQGTPAMVLLQYANGKQMIDSGTYWCAIGSGELSDKGTLLTQEQLEWLNSIEDEINDFLWPKK